MDQIKATASSLPSRLSFEDSGKKIAAASACVVGFIVVRNLFSFTLTHVERRRSRQRKLDHTQTCKSTLLQKLVTLKTPIDNRDVLTELSFTELRTRVRNNDLSAVDLLQAFQAKALDVDRRLNCVTEVVGAEETALSLDTLSVERRGRLHAIPISVKDCISLSGFDSTFGCASRCFKPEPVSAAVLKALMKEGAIPFMRTNLCQIVRGIHSINPVFGETVNPFDHTRTSGGSSGGEAALIGGGGSILGIGSDSGGSIRVPASYCGIFSFKPTSARSSLKGSAELSNPWKTLFISGAYGPLSRDLELLVEVMKTIFSDSLFSLDLSIPRLLFDHFTFEDSKPLRIGVYSAFSDSPLTVRPVPAVQRNVKLVREALEARGHCCVDWEPPRVGQLCKLLIELTHWEKGVLFQKFAGDEVLTSSDKYDLCIYSLNPFLKWIITPIVKRWNPVLGTYFRHSHGLKKITDIASLEATVNAHRSEFENSWLEAGLDAVLCPVVPFVAPKIGQTENVVFNSLYTRIYNFFDCPAGVVPVGKVTEDDILDLKRTYPRQTADYTAVFDSQVDSVGMPIGVQCVAMKFRDEMALKLMKEVKKACL